MNQNQINHLPFIISASSRTGISAFYTEWFINWVRAGYCLFPYPFNPAETSLISLCPDDMDVIVFWTHCFRYRLPKKSRQPRLEPPSSAIELVLDPQRGSDGCDRPARVKCLS